MSKTKQSDAVNRRAMLLALVPLALTIIVLAGLYYTFFHKANKDQVIRFATGIQGTANRELIESIGNQLQSNRKDFKIEFKPTTGTEENIRLLESGKVDVVAIPADALHRPNFSLIANLYPDTYHLVVHRDSKIVTIHDLPGKNIAVPPFSTSAYASFWYLVGQYGLSPETVRAIPMSTNQAFEAIKAHKIDGIFYMRPPANRLTRWIADAARVKILKIDQANAMALRRDSLTAVVIPKGVYGGMPPVPFAATPSVAANRILITRKDFPSDMVRALTAVMFDNRRELVTNSRLASFIEKPNLASNTILPVHAGAMAFYNRDQPTFLQENAEPIGVLFSIFAILISSGLWLKRRWEEGQKGRIDDYNLELVGITNTARAALTTNELAKQKEHLFDMLANVVRDLDEDKIDGKGFHFFAFTWQAALSIIETREAELGMIAPFPGKSRTPLRKLTEKSAGKTLATAKTKRVFK